MGKTRRNVLAAVTLAVVVIAAWVSYWHGVEVCLKAGELAVSAHLIPLLPDAMMITAGVVVSAPGGTRKRRLWSRAGLWLGIGASISANMAAARGGVLSLVVAGWPAVTLLVTAEMLMAMVITTPARPRVRRKAAAPVKSTARKAAPARKLAVA